MKVDSLINRYVHNFVCKRIPLDFSTGHIQAHNNSNNNNNNNNNFKAVYKLTRIVILSFVLRVIAITFDVFFHTLQSEIVCH